MLELAAPPFDRPLERVHVRIAGARILRERGASRGQAIERAANLIATQAAARELQAPPLFGVGALVQQRL